MKITGNTSIPFSELTEEYRQRPKSVVYLSGVGTATIKFVDENGDMNEIPEGTLTAPSSTIVAHGIGANLIIEVEGGSEASPTFITILPLE